MHFPAEKQEVRKRSRIEYRVVFNLSHMVFLYEIKKRLPNSLQLILQHRLAREQEYALRVGQIIRAQQVITLKFLVETHTPPSIIHSKNISSFLRKLVQFWKDNPSWTKDGFCPAGVRLEWLFFQKRRRFHEDEATRFGAPLHFRFLEMRAHHSAHLLLRNSL